MRLRRLLKAKPYKACAVCKEWFTPRNSLHKVCSVSCANAFPKAQQWKKDAQAFRKAEAERKANKPKRSGNARSGPERRAQDAVHAFIHERDHDKPCIVHGWGCLDSEFDAGHYKSRGSEPALRFNTWNIHKQCRSSNRGAHNRKHFKDSVPGMFRSNLVDRIGEERVAKLEGPQKAKQYKAHDLKRIASLFNRRARNYRKWREIRGL